jgi:transcriptional regulator with XRE-family HTH domain
MPGKKNNRKKIQPLEENQQVFEKIGNHIKALRLAAGYSNAEKFAFENEITRSQYANWEKGQDMKVSSLLRITQTHGITIQQFFAGME